MLIMQRKGRKQRETITCSTLHCNPMRHLEKSEFKSEERRAKALLIGFPECVASVRYNCFTWYLVNCFPRLTWGGGRAGEGDQNPTCVCCPCHGRENTLVPEQHQEPLFLDGIFICVGSATVSGDLGHLASKFSYFQFLLFFFPHLIGSQEDLNFYWWSPQQHSGYCFTLEKFLLLKL